jgi:hypothetical protein
VDASRAVSPAGASFTAPASMEVSEAASFASELPSPTPKGSGSNWPPEIPKTRVQPTSGAES